MVAAAVVDEAVLRRADDLHPALRVLDAARQTTVEEPLLPLAQDDSWFLLNCILNALSEEFATGLNRRDRRRLAALRRVH